MIFYIADAYVLTQDGSQDSGNIEVMSALDRPLSQITKGEKSGFFIYSFFKFHLTKAAPKTTWFVIQIWWCDNAVVKVWLGLGTKTTWLD